jgi:DsbC/DsbD-like thiol-disulfide interchange protein
MKKIILSLFVLLSATVVSAQLNPITWSFSATKIGDKTYELHMKATIQNGWHLYSQTQPEDAIAIPTNFTFNSNPLVKLDGKIKEVGKMEKFSDEKLGISANQYSHTVDFVQVVKLKVNTKTALTGSVEYQTCDDKKCLPPKTVNFTAPIQ